MGLILVMGCASNPWKQVPICSESVDMVAARRILYQQTDTSTGKPIKPRLLTSRFQSVPIKRVRLIKPVVACFPSGQKDKPLNTDEFIRILDEALRRRLTKKKIFHLVEVSSDADAEMHVEIMNLYRGAGMPGFFTRRWQALQGMPIPIDLGLARCAVVLTDPSGKEVIVAYWSESPKYALTDRLISGLWGGMRGGAAAIIPYLDVLVPPTVFAPRLTGGNIKAKWLATSIAEEARALVSASVQSSRGTQSNKP